MKTIASSAPLLDGPATQSKLVEHFRGQIVAGLLSPGQKLPTRDELTHAFGTTRDTVQRAFDVLIEHGFISTEGRRGTFVAPHPPHLARYALIFPDKPAADLQWSRFWNSLCHQAIQLETGRHCKIPVFYAVAQDRSSRGYRQLFEEASTHRLSGLIFTFNPEIIMEFPRLQATGLPMVAIMTSSRLQQVPFVTIDSHSFFRKALGYLAGKGRKRVAILDSHGAVRNTSREEVADEIRKNGMESRSYWWQAVHLQGADAARDVVHLLAHADQRERPDALIILDDNLEAAALTGLRDAGLTPGLDIDVVAHCNLPSPNPVSSGTQRLGYDSAQVLNACLDGFAARRQGEHAHQFLIEAHFEGPSSAGSITS